MKVFWWNTSGSKWSISALWHDSIAATVALLTKSGYPVLVEMEA